MTNPIIWSYALTQQPTTPLTEKDAIEMIESDAPAWAHLDATAPETEAWLREHVSYLPSITIDALLAEEARPRAEKIQEGVLLILRGVNLNDGAEPEDMVSLRLWIDPSRVITLRKRMVRAARETSHQLEQGLGPDSSSAFLTRIIGLLLEFMEPVLANMEDEVDDLEDELIENAQSGLRHKISKLRRRALLLRRYISPQRDAIAKLRLMELKWLTPEDKMRLQESYDRISRYIEHLDALRERCQIVQDELATTLADKLNRNTYVLTLIAAIFLPLGFLTGLLGINVGGMPGVDSSDAFNIVSGICILIAVIELAIFKKLRWF
ncbi:MAG: zinc transporter ZntB [Rickettsiales bacterium]|nr:zinc transporter ZntB [Rickettsiales bacterium]